MSDDLSMLIQAAAILLLIVAAVSDVARRIIPDEISLALVALGIVAGLLRGPFALVGSFVVAALLFAVLAVLNWRGMIGGGDVKLASAVALMLPLRAFGGFLEMTALVGGALALLHLVLRPIAPRLAPQRGASLARRVLAAECWRLRRRGSLPYGVAIAGAGAFMLLHWS